MKAPMLFTTEYETSYQAQMLFLKVRVTQTQHRIYGLGILGILGIKHTVCSAESSEIRWQTPCFLFMPANDTPHSTTQKVATACVKWCLLEEDASWYLSMPAKSLLLSSGITCH